MMTVAFSSCKKQEENVAEPIVLSRDAISEYVIVYGEGIGDELKSKVGELSLKFKDKFGVAVSAKDDYFKEGVDALAIKETEILIGVTNREESKSFIGSLKSRDYGWKAINKKLVIGGVNDEMTVKAIDEFISKVLSKDSAEGAFYTSDSDFTYTEEYEMDTITVGGTDITEYTVVYNDDVYGMQYLAELIRNAIADKCGHYLSVVKAAKAEGMTITVDITDTDKNSLLCEKLGNGNITVGGGSSQAVYQTALALADKIGGLATAELDVSVTGAIQDNEITVFNWNIKGEDGSKIVGERADAYKAAIDEFKPDIIMFQEANLGTISKNMLNNVLGSDYALATEYREDINMPHTVSNITFYNKNTVKPIFSTYFWHSDTPDEISQFPEGEYVKMTVISEFEQLSTGKRALSVNVHLNFAKKGATLSTNDLQAKEMGLILDWIEKYKAENPTSTVIMGGDFNAEKSGKAIQNALKYGFVNSSAVARNAIECNTFPGNNHVIDFVLVSDGGALISSYIAKDMGAYVANGSNGNPSDHNPVIVKLCLTPELLK